MIRLDEIRNENTYIYIRGILEVTNVVGKTRENGLERFGRYERRQIMTK